MLLKEAIN